MYRSTSIASAVATLSAPRLDALLAEIETAMAFARSQNHHDAIADLEDERDFLLGTLKQAA